MKRLFKNISVFLNTVFAWPGRSKRSFKTIGFAISCALAIVASMVVLILWSVHPKVALFVDSVTLKSASEITVGRNSGICYSNLPHECMTISNTSKGYKWQIDENLKDSLPYFKINNNNPNLHLLDNSSNYVVNVDGDSLRCDDIYDAWESFKEQQYVLARNLVAYTILCKENVTAQDSAKANAVMRDKSLRSFFNKKDGDISLVILDRKTYLRNDTATVGYNFCDSVSIDNCKIQFYSITDYSYKDNDDDEDYFRIDGVNYVMKPIVKLTSWGAGHVMLRKNQQGGVVICFPKGLGFVGSMDSVRIQAEKVGGNLSVKQQEDVIPTSNDLYLPQLSALASQDICSIRTDSATGGMFICDNSKDSFEVINYSTFMPKLNKVELVSNANAKINTRVGSIDANFLLSYFVVPFVVYLVLLTLILYKWSVFRLQKYERFSFSNTKQIKTHPKYLALLLTIALFYCFCKVLIAFKLSYTFPYFEKMTGITTVSISLLLLVAFTMSVLLNSQFVFRALAADMQFLGNSGKKVWSFATRRWVAWAVVVLLTISVGWVLLMFDRDVSQGMLDSYLKQEVYSLKVWKWTGIVGINDTHRSVPYTLFLVEFVLLAVWFILNIVPLNAVLKCVRNIKSFGQYLRNLRFVVLLIKIIMYFFSKIVTYIKDTVSKLYVAINKHCSFAGKCISYLYVPCLGLGLALRRLLPWHFVLLVLLAVVGSVAGNFGTAFITLGVVFGLSHALTSDEFESPADIGGYPRSVIIWKMFIVTLIYIAFAMFADHGYMTNYLGFIMALISFYFLFDRYNIPDPKDDDNDRTEKNWLLVLSVIIVAFIVFMPSLCRIVFSTQDVNYSRMSRRMMLYSDFVHQRDEGYRYSDSDAEFMVIMNHYMQHSEGGDPLSNDNHFLHQSVSSGQSPVVLNDLSVPIAFIGSYGVFKATVIYFLLLLCLVMLVMYYSTSFVKGNASWDQMLFFPSIQWRMLAMFMWLGTSMYIYLSYLGLLPFTGRLNPGFGVDSVGEALETSFLLAFMSVMTIKKSNE